MPKSFGNLRSLKTLTIYGVTDHALKQRHEFYGPISQKRCNLRSLPKSFGDLESLEILKIFNCNLESLPESIGKLKAIKKLELRKNNIKTLPRSLGNLKVEKNHFSGFSFLFLPNLSIRSLKSTFFLRFFTTTTMFYPFDLQIQSFQNKFKCSQSVYSFLRIISYPWRIVLNLVDL